MYTIEITQRGSVNVATLYFLFPFDKFKDREIKDVKMHVDFSILANEIKSWGKFLRQNES